MTLDIASQVLKSRNAGVLRTGSVALRSSEALMAHVVAPAMRDAGLAPGALQLTPHEGRCATHALVSLPDLVPLVILRGSGESTRDPGWPCGRRSHRRPGPRPRCGAVSGSATDGPASGATTGRRSVLNISDVSCLSPPRSARCLAFERTSSTCAGVVPRPSSTAIF
ncbi:hypothetical protein ACFXDH_46150 [Streptomyces sp. NPDC059467]|uniref:hypothetical protein n=1 Tax=Streptomyces sp. NPDC059467 TaxID=3346844 RepID=UPI0036B042A0